jgi:hypothetical protein
LNVVKFHESVVALRHASLPVVSGGLSRTLQL